MKVTADGYFAIIPEWVLYADISPAAVRVYCVLHRHADNDTAKCIPSRKHIASKARLGLSSVDRAIDELVRIKALIVQHRKSENGDPTSNEYTVIVNRPLSTQNRPPIENEQTGLFKSDNLIKANLNESQESNTSSKDDGFDDFWKMYPRKDGKGRARIAWRSALTKARKEEILAGLNIYATLRRGQDPHYTALPASWLNAERWADETLKGTMPEHDTPEPEIPRWEPCSKCNNGWLYTTDDKGYEYAHPCECRPG